MSGILFFRTRMLAKLKNFYLDRVGCRLWLDQHDCIILQHGNLLLGFCERETADSEGMVTFFYPTKEEVDWAYDTFKDIAESPPALNDKYNTYNFFSRDPEGRQIEFQCFDHPVDQFLTGVELLHSRRSVRHFQDTEIPRDVLNHVLEICRFAPTARNSQSYYFKIIRDRKLLSSLAEVRGKSTSPIGRAPLGVAICSDPELSKRHVQDGCIAAYHFILAAYYFGLGTCWIAAMDREEVKRILNIPEAHYVVTVTPLGYPKHRTQKMPERKELSWFIRE